MRFFYSLLVLMSFSFSLSAQSLNPVSWTFEAKKISNNEYDLNFIAEVEEGWFIYSQNIDPDAGPIPTSINIEQQDDFELVGEVKEEGYKKEGFDEIFQTNLIKFGKKTTFTQRVKVSNKSTIVKGYLEFMCCDDQKCLPPKDMEFTFNFE